MHCGRDPAGAPFPVPAAIASLDTDVVLVQEDWRPAGAAASLARRAAADCGYPYVAELDLIAGTSLARLGVVPGTRADERGATGLAVLSRRPMRELDRIPLGAVPGDLATRAAQVVEIAVDDGFPLRLVNVHLTYRLPYGPAQVRRLVRTLRPDGTPTVIAGDFNMCRPTVYLARPYRPAVRGRTWPARRPLAQLDHVLVDGGVAVVGGGVAVAVGSDHLPVRVNLVRLPT